MRVAGVSGAALLLLLALVTMGRPARPAAADSYVPVSGAGSSWSANALNQWIADVQQVGMRVNYAPTGSSDGRHQFLQGTVDFAASDIPFQSHPEDGSAPEQPSNYAYMPITAGGTVFMYNLVINGQRVTNLRLSGQNVMKIFTGVIKNWDDPALAADNPGLRLPNRPVVPVVRSDGSGSTAQLTLWMIAQFPDLWNAYCHASGRAPACGSTSYYPTVNGMIAQSGDLGVAGYVSQNYADGAIGYVNYSYALNDHFPVVKLLNVAGYYTEPTPQNVAVSLLKAQVDTVDVNDPSLYLTQKLGDVYTDPDPRTYELSSYSYFILPTKVQGQFSTAKGKTLAGFSYYAMCQGQQESAALGYSPMPVNLVQASFDQIKKIPGAVVENINITSCNNPTFSPTSPNLLADTAPQPQACDKQGPTQCSSGTGGASGTSTAVSSGSGGAGSSEASGSSSSSSSRSGPTGAGSARAGSGAAGTGRGATAAAGGARSAGSGGARSLGGAAGSVASNGGTGTGSGTGGGSAASAACDPSTGGCSATNDQAQATSDGSASSGNQSAAATPYTVAAAKGWTGTQTLMVLVAVLIMALVVAPGVAARWLANRRE
jgi:phosphate transport system substrate-binding protein